MMRPKTTPKRCLAVLGLGLALVGCNPTTAPAPAPTQPAASPEVSTRPPESRANPAAPGKAAIPPALSELKAKIEPQVNLESSKKPPQEPQAPTQPAVENAGKLAESARKIAEELASQLLHGNVAQAEALCLSGKSLGKVLMPSYVGILGDGAQAQNKEALEHLALGLKGKEWTPEVEIGKVTRAPAKSPFIEGTLLVSGTVLRFRSGAISLEAHIEEIVAFGEELKIFRLSAP